MRHVLGRSRRVALRGREATASAIAVVVLIMAVGGVLFGLFAWTEPDPRGPLATMVYSAGVTALTVSGLVLWLRARAVGSGRLGWLAAIYLAEGGVAVVRMGAQVLRSDTGRQSADGASATSTLLAVYIFAIGALLAARTSRFRPAPPLAAVAGCCLAAVMVHVFGAGLLDFYDESLALRPLARLIWGFAGILGAVSIWRIWRAMGTQVVGDWTIRWPVLSLLCAVASIICRVISPRLYEAGWWTAVCLQALAGLIPLLGLVVGATTLLHRLEGFTEQLAVGLETEVRRASAGPELDDEDTGPAAASPGQFAGSCDADGLTAERRASALDALLVGRDLTVVLQAVVDLSTGEVEGVEALSRISGRGSTPPTEFFADAAAAGISREAELLAVRRALDMLGALPLGPWLALNVSPTTAASTELADLLRGHDRSRIVLELTEHTEVEEYDALVDALTRLRDTGVRIAVDDAGAGFSSFRHVVRLRPEIVKLDMSLVAGIDTDPVRRALVASLVSFSTSIGSLVIAEGIETRAELEVLTGLHVHLGQGYLLGRPRPAPEALVVTLPDTAAARAILAAR